MTETPPTDRQLQEALTLISSPQLRRAFFEGLHNPCWLGPLAEKGAFRTPPEPETTADGLVRDYYWPEIGYLTRIAPRDPRSVVDILLQLKETENSWVRRAVFEIGAKIPASEGARLKPLLDAWKTTTFGWRTDPREMVAFAVALLDGGETKAGRWLANVLFEPRASKSDDPYFQKPELEITDYWYREELPRIVAALGSDAFKAVSGWLAKYVEFSGHVRAQYDSSAMLRSEIRSRDDSHGSPLEVLVETVRDLAVGEFVANPRDASKVLLRPGMGLLRKIAMFAVAEAIRRRVGEGLDTSGLVEVAKPLLEDDSSDDIYLRVEYAELAQEVGAVNPAALNGVTGFIASCYERDLQWMRERLTDEDSCEKATEGQIYERADRYKHNWLSAIGASSLPPLLQTELLELDVRFGPIDEPRTPLGKVTTWSGPNPHTGQVDMAKMSPTELVTHLASWHDRGDGWGPEPSHEGQGRELTALLATSPSALEGVTDLDEQLRPTYLRAVLRGWEAALKADLEFDWSQAGDLISNVLTHGDESSFPVEGGTMDDDTDFRLAKSAAVGLLEELVKKREAVSIPDEAVGRFAGILIVETADEVAWNEYDSYERDENSWDPLTMSLNWQWPKRVRGLFYLATRDKEAAWKSEAFNAIEFELARQDRHGAGRAVLGENFGRLFNDSPDWLKAHLETYFGTKDAISVEQQVALTTAMATHYYHRELLNFLSDPIIAAIAVGDGLVSGWRSESNAQQRIGEWVIDAVIYGHRTMDDELVQSFFNNASAKARGDAMAHVAWSFFRADPVDDSIRDRFAELWDARIEHVRDHPNDSEELLGIYWCAKGGKFDVSWWLSRLLGALQLEPGVATERYMIGKELAEASADDPRTALEVLKLLLDGRDEDGMVSHDLTRNAVPVVIAGAIASTDEDLSRDAEKYMNDLGAKGNLRLEADVKAVLDGAVTVEDVDD